MKHIIGYETSFKGAMLIFNMFQHPSLNRRLLFVLLENLLIALFPSNKMPELFQKLHSASPKQSNEHPASEKENDKEPQTHKESMKEIEVACEAKEIKNEELKEKPNVKTKESKKRLNFQCLSQQSVSSPKQSRKRKKSVETAVFYTDLEENEDTVILPLGR